MKCSIHPLDFVKTPEGAIAIVDGVKTTQGEVNVSITFVGFNHTQEKNAWWREDELEVVDSLPHILAKTMAHSMDFDCKRTAEELFSITSRLSV